MNSSLAVQESRNYAPFGEVWGTTGTSQTNYGFTGEPTDSNWLVYLRARYLNPAFASFLSQDKVESLNRFFYADANPVNRVDPTGMMVEQRMILVDDDTVSAVLPGPRPRPTPTPVIQPTPPSTSAQPIPSAPPPAPVSATQPTPVNTAPRPGRAAIWEDGNQSGPKYASYTSPIILLDGPKSSDLDLWSDCRRCYSGAQYWACVDGRITRCSMLTSPTRVPTITQNPALPSSQTPTWGTAAWLAIIAPTFLSSSFSTAGELVIAGGGPENPITDIGAGLIIVGGILVVVGALLVAATAPTSVKPAIAQSIEGAQGSIAQFPAKGNEKNEYNEKVQEAVRRLGGDPCDILKMWYDAARAAGNQVEAQKIKKAQKAINCRERRD